jgi:hypothetical protein
MKKRSRLWKILAIANAVLVTAAFVGCPARKNSNVAPPTILPPTIAPPPPPFVTIAPYGGNVRDLLPSDSPAPPPQGSNNDKRSP